jgi:tetratricopeptide (TPR) repeat protein
MAGAVSLVTLRAQAAGGSRSFLEPLPLAARGASAAIAYAAYLGKTLWPMGLAFFYPNPGRVLGTMKVAAAALLLAALSILALRHARRHPALAAGWLWFLGMLAPMSGLVQFGAQQMADRYTYLPHVGLFLGLAAALPAALARRPRLRLPLAAVAAAIVLVLVAASARQTLLWRDDRTLYGHAAAVTRRNWMAHNLLGTTLIADGDAAGAERHFRLSLDARPGYTKAHYNLALALQRQGKLDEAAVENRRVIDADPFYVEAYNNLGTVMFMQGRIDEAADLFERAVRMKPGYRDAWVNLALARSRQGRYQEAAAAERLAGR